MLEREIFERIEEVIASITARKMDQILGPKEQTTEKLFELRGQAQACKEIAAGLRNALGYHPEDFI